MPHLLKVLTTSQQHEAEDHGFYISFRDIQDPNQSIGASKSFKSFHVGLGVALVSNLFRRCAHCVCVICTCVLACMWRLEVANLSAEVESHTHLRAHRLGWFS